MENSIANAQNKVKGVFFDKRRSKWIVNIKLNGKCKFLGYFLDYHDAVAARRKAEDIYRKPIYEAREKFEKDVISYYLKGNTLEQTGGFFSKNGSTIYDILVKHNIQTRDNFLDLDTNCIKVLYSEGKTIQYIAKLFNVSHNVIRNRLLAEGIVIRENRTYIINNIFEHIDNDVSAYYLGLFMADGNVRKDLLNASMLLHEKDKYLLEYLSNLIFRHTHLDIRPETSYLDKKTQKTYTSSPAFRINICNKSLCESLVSYGCTPNKSLNLKWPIIPRDYYGAFLRGFFDGDGYISVKGDCVMIISSDEFCAGLQSYLKENLNIESKIKKAGKVSRIFIFKQSQLKILKDFMYHNAKIYLKRKYERFR